MRRVILNIGEFAVSREPAILETILGSCVGICLWDMRLGIGGLNHYLLPAEQQNAPSSSVYGGTSIDLLVTAMLRAGAVIEDMQAQIYGGGSVIERLDEIFNIGMENIYLARQKMQDYGIPIVCEHIRAGHGIRVVFKTRTGEVTVTPLGHKTKQVSAGELLVAHRLMQPCKTCIMCGSCTELLNRKVRAKEK